MNEPIVRLRMILGDVPVSVRCVGQTAGDVIFPLLSNLQAQYKHSNMAECVVRVSSLVMSPGDTRVWGKYIKTLANGRDAIYAYERYRDSRFRERRLASISERRYRCSKYPDADAMPGGATIEREMGVGRRLARC
jgi:hypothetical protein